MLKNSSIGHSSKNGFLDLFDLIGFEQAFGWATKLVRWQPLVQAEPPPAKISRREPSGAFLIAIETKIGFFQQSVDFGRPDRATSAGGIIFKTCTGNRAQFRNHQKFWGNFNEYGKAGRGAFSMFLSVEM